jgi:Asp-tRNA(Asn)/Glu-tRNA(Gln) amidotransferase A subunit family amidase
VIPADAIDAGESDVEQTTVIMKFAFVANFLGLPAVSVPVAPLDDLNVPIGLQLMGAHYTEDKLLRIAAAAEDIRFEKYA